MEAKKHLGQHFLTSEAAVAAMVTAGEVGAEDTVVEIGPGKGVLTRALLDTGATVIAIEKDTDLIPELTERFAQEIAEGKLVLEELDVRAFVSPNKNYKLVANIPYYITGDIIRQFLGSNTPPTVMVLLMQKEVARRIVANDKKESILSLSVKTYGTPKYVQTVKAGSFMPKPKVDSAILKVSNINKNFFTDVSEEFFFTLIKQGFSEKRKQVINHLGVEKEKARDALRIANLSETIRAEDITLEEWNVLAHELV